MPPLVPVAKGGEADIVHHPVRHVQQESILYGKLQASQLLWRGGGNDDRIHASTGTVLGILLHIVLI